MTKAPIDLSAQSCRQQAVNCRETAEATMTPPHRIMLEHIADTWERIASDIDKANQ
jgi:hypothetical protein